MTGPLAHRLRHALGMRLLRTVLWLVNPTPKRTDGPEIADLVIADVRRMPAGPARDALLAEVERRRDLGRAKYGTALQADNGRDGWTDALGEFIDGAKYVRQAAEKTRSPAVRRRAMRLHADALRMALEVQRELLATAWSRR